MACTHTNEKSYWHEEEDWYHGGTIGEWRCETINTYVDLDLHRFKCTQCNEIFYYSGRARDYYEKGIKSEWITGLDK